MTLEQTKLKRARYNTGQRGARTLQIIAMRKNNPCATLQQIGDKFSVSRELVRQVLSRDQLPTRHYVKHQLYQCLNCGKPTLHKRYCSNECSYEYTHPLVECDQCHRLFHRWQSYLIRQSQQHTHYFCSKKCYGKYLATHYGFSVHPENIGYPKGTHRKYDYDKVATQIKELRNKGFTYGLIAKELGISSSSLSLILTKMVGQTPRKGLIKHLHSHKRIFPLQHIRARWLKHLNFTDKEIIDTIHCSASTISRALQSSKK